MDPKWLDIFFRRDQTTCSFLKASTPETNHPVDEASIESGRRMCTLFTPLAC